MAAFIVKAAPGNDLDKVLNALPLPMIELLADMFCSIAINLIADAEETACPKLQIKFLHCCSAGQSSSDHNVADPILWNPHVKKQRSVGACHNVQC